MKQQLRSFNTQRGDVTIIYTIFMLMMILLTALVLAGLVSTVRQLSRNVPAAARALYAADTGIERGLFEYIWSDPADPVCANLTGVGVGAATGVTYDVKVEGGKRAGRRQTSPPQCPPAAEINTLADALCIGATGNADQNTVRRLRNDTDPADCE